MSDDVEHAGWAIDTPASRLRRRRSPLLGLLAIVLLVIGTAASVIGLVRLISDAGVDDARVVARGTVAALDGPATPPVAFEARAGERFTLWLHEGGASNVRESLVAGTECTATRPEDTAARVRGSRQGTSVATDHDETIGTFATGAGTTAVACRHVPFGGWRNRGRLRDQHAFVVERGTPGDGLSGLWLLFPGIGVAMLGGWALVRWRAGSLRPR
ncbi:MAG TPA: hypothetical protein VGO48_02420 [Conexibacter sp.]|nr:hypothetical protein [Conexibacter sp.]